MKAMERFSPAQDAGLDVVGQRPNRRTLHQALDLIQLIGETRLQRLVVQRRVGGLQPGQQAGEDAVDPNRYCWHHVRLVCSTRAWVLVTLPVPTTLGNLD
jgi:hypothetical protein